MPNQPCFFHFTSQLLTIHHEPDVQSLLVKAQLTRGRKSISSSNQKFFKNWYTFACYNHVHRVKCPHTGAQSRQYQTRRFYKNHKTNRLNCATMTPPTSSNAYKLRVKRGKPRTQPHTQMSIGCSYTEVVFKWKRNQSDPHWNKASG